MKLNKVQRQILFVLKEKSLTIRELRLLLGERRFRLANLRLLEEQRFIEPCGGFRWRINENKVLNVEDIEGPLHDAILKRGAYKKGDTITIDNLIGYIRREFDY